MAIDAQPAITPARCGCECKACVSSPPMPVAGSMSYCSGVWMIESCNRWPSMLSRPSLQLDADAMQMRVQSMPLAEIDGGSCVWVSCSRWPSMLSEPSLRLDADVDAFDGHCRTRRQRTLLRRHVVQVTCGHPIWPSHVASPCGQNLLRREDYARIVIGWPNHRPTWPVATVDGHCRSRRHTAPPTAGQARPGHVASPCGQPMWPAHVARICSGVRIMLALLSVGRTTGQRGQWPLSMATVAPTGHFFLGRGLLGRLGTLLRLATRTGSVGHGSVGHQNLKSRRALGVGSARAPGERWKVSTSQYHFVVARWPG
jgi:hypothetical protein